MKVKKTYYIACREGIYHNLMHFPLERAEHTDIEQAMRYYNREFAESELERYRERNEGRPVSAMVDGKPTKARYVRCYSAGSSSEPVNNYIEIEVFGK